MNAIGIDYNVKLQRIARAVKRDIDAVIIPEIEASVKDYTYDSALLTMDGWVARITRLFAGLIARWDNPLIKRKADDIAADFVKTALKKSERDIRKSVAIDVFTHNEKMREYLKASAVQNAELITSIPKQYLTDVSTAVVANMRSGMRPSAIVLDLQERFGVTKRRAEFIARDQTGKIQGDLAEKQQRDAGFEYFQWIDSHDARVRHRHFEIANKLTAYGKGIYRWDDLPLSEDGEPIKPGQDFNCRCSSKPVSARQVAENQRKGLVAEGVYR